MNWNQNLTNRLAEWLRFAVRASLMITCLAAAIAFTYLSVKLCWFTVRWLDRIWFSGAW